MNTSSSIVEDKVNSPSHYKQGKFETIEIIEQVTKGYDNSFVGYCVGNTIKYLSRAPFKHETPLEDLKKAYKYLEFAIKELEGKKITDKERLEGIEESFMEHEYDFNLKKEDIKWLIKQAEKREYWMKQHRKRANELEDAYFTIQLIEKQLQQAQAKAERYKHALEFYADENNWIVYEGTVETVPGEKARKALEGEE